MARDDSNKNIVNENEAYDFQRLYDKAWTASEQRSWTYGRLGYKDIGSTSYTLVVPSSPGFLYVTLGGDLKGEVVPARNTGVPQVEQLPIKMRNEKGVWVIHGIDTVTGALEDFLAGPAGNPSGVAPHTHRIDSDLTFSVESMRLEPARLVWSSGLVVSVTTFRYRSHGGVWRTWLGGTIDLTSTIPVTSGHWGWVLICINTETNTLTSIPGTTQPYATPLTASQIDDITPTAYFIPCGAVKVRNDATVLSDYALYGEARGWLNIADDLRTLDDLADVDAATPSDADVLMFSTFDNTWHTGAIELTLDDITDVLLTTPDIGDVLSFNGTDWVNEPTTDFIRADGTVPLGTTVRWDIGAGNSIAGEVIAARSSSGLILQDDGSNNSAKVRDGGPFELLSQLVSGSQAPDGSVHLALSVGYLLVKGVTVTATPVTVVTGSLASSPTAVCSVHYGVKTDIVGVNGGGFFTVLLSATHVETIGSVSWTFTLSGAGLLTVEQTAGSPATSNFSLVIVYL